MHLIRNLSIKVGSAFLCIFFTDIVATGSEKPTNVIVFLTDDQGYADVGIYGSDNVDTPHIDQLAKDGIKFTSFYAQPLCGPSRAALLTGRYPVKIKEPGGKKKPNTVLGASEITIAEILKQAGYKTALIGKWHLAGEGAPWDYAAPVTTWQTGGKGPFKMNSCRMSRVLTTFLEPQCTMAIHSG